MEFTDWALIAVFGIIVGVYVWSQVSARGSSRRMHEKVFQLDEEAHRVNDEYKKQIEETRQVNEKFLKQGEAILNRLDTIIAQQTQIDTLTRELEEVKRKLEK